MDGLQVGFYLNSPQHFGCVVIHEDVMVAISSTTSFGQ